MENGKLKTSGDEMSAGKDDLKDLMKRLKTLEGMVKQIASWCDQAEAKAYAAKNAAVDVYTLAREAKECAAKMMKKSK